MWNDTRLTNDVLTTHADDHRALLQHNFLARVITSRRFYMFLGYYAMYDIIKVYTAIKAENESIKQKRDGNNKLY